MVEKYRLLNVILRVPIGCIIYKQVNMIITDERSGGILYAAPSYVSTKFTTTIFTRYGWLANSVIPVDAIAEGSSTTAVRPFR